MSVYFFSSFPLGCLVSFQVPVSSVLWSPQKTGQKEEAKVPQSRAYVIVECSKHEGKCKTA